MNLTLKQYFGSLSPAYNDAEAQVIGQEITRLHEDGVHTPAEIVEAARPEDAPLHPFFCWDDAAAAELFREAQAIHMTCSIVVRRRDNGRPKTDAPKAGARLIEHVRRPAPVPVPADRLPSKYDLARALPERNTPRYYTEQLTDLRFRLAGMTEAIRKRFLAEEAIQIARALQLAREVGVCEGALSVLRPPLAQRVGAKQG